jgi:hypothetical protein
VRNKFLSFSLAAILCLSGGCALTRRNILNASDGEKLYAVTSAKAPFYKLGPQQGGGPDLELPRDTMMTLIRPSFGYSKVHLVNGQEGFVASEDIKPASPALIAALSAPPPGPEQSTHGERFELNSNDPRLAVPPEDLPENNPEPTPLPGASPN